MSLTDDDNHWLATQLGNVEQHLEERFEARIEATDAKIEATETKLLRALHDWASPVEMRVKSHTAVLRAMDAEIESLGNPVSKLEPPH